MIKSVDTSRWLEVFMSSTLLYNYTCRIRGDNIWLLIKVLRSYYYLL